MALSDLYPGIRQGTPYTSRWQSFLDDLRQQGVHVDPRQSGGYNPRNIRGTNTPSLHASDRAYDVNWGANPEGSVQDEADIARQHLERDMGGSTAPITRLHPMIARETAARHGARWGGDFRTRSPDPQHFDFPAAAPGGMPGRSLVAHAGLTPPASPPTAASATTGAAPMATAGGSGLQPGFLNWLIPQAQAATGGGGGFSPEMLAQITQALQPQAPPAQPQRPAGGGMFDSLLPPEQRGTGTATPLPNLDRLLPSEQRGPAPSAPLGVPQMPAAQQTPSALDVGWQQPPEQPQNIEAPLPITPMDPQAVVEGATAAQGSRQAAEAAQPGYFERLMGNPAFLAGLSILGTAPGGNWGPNAAQTLQSATANQRRTRQQSTMDRVWAEAFPNGQPNTQHPLLAGQSPQVAAMLHSLGPDAALPLLAKSAMERRQLELKDIGGQGVIFNPTTGATSAVPGMQGGGKPPSGYRWAGDGQLEPIPGGPGEHIAGEQAGKLAVMRTAQNHFQSARGYFLGNQFGASAAARHSVGGAMLSPQYDQAARTVKLAVEGALRAVSGAAAPEAEVQRLTDFFTPRAFDPPEVRKQKMDMLQEFMRNHEEIVTRGRRQGGGQQQPGTRLRYDPATGELTNAN